MISSENLKITNIKGEKVKCESKADYEFISYKIDTNINES